jgi:hypothetical protein
VTFPFSAQKGVVVVQAEVFGPLGSIVLRLALDTNIVFALAGEKDFALTCTP